MSKSRSDIDRLFEQGVSEVTRQPKHPLSEAQIASAAAASKSGFGILLLSHAREILLCAVSLLVGIGGTLLVTQFAGNRDTVPAMNETVATAATDTTRITDTAMAAEETAASPMEISAPDAKTTERASRQTDRRVAPSRNHTSNVSSPVSHASRRTSRIPRSTSPEPVIVKKTVVQRDTVVLNETVILKDTVYVP